MIITATEFKVNLGKYLDMVDKEEIIITRNGKRIARLVDANDKTDLVKSLRGILPTEAANTSIRDERLAKQ